METIETIGICRHLDPERDIDEYVWVEENFSINTSGYINTLKFEGKECKGDRTVNLQHVIGYDPTDEQQNKTLRALFKVNTPAVIAPTLGFVMGCWLRTHIRDNGSTDKHLPILQMYGSSGHGKTETATMFAALAGADYMNHEPVVISSSTPFAIRCEASISTTVPRIFDEMNEHRNIDKNRYTQAYEAVKMAARGGYMSSGNVRDNKQVIDNVPASSALIMLATQVNSSTEIEERTIPVSINRHDRTSEHANSFLYVRENFQHLVKMARTAMETTLHLDPQWASDCVKYNKGLIPTDIQDRIAVNWRFALVGLDYFTYILETKQTPKDILASVLELKQSLLDYLEEHKEEFSTQNATQEIDNVIDTFGEMVIQDNGYSKLYKHGEQYIVQGDTLHIWSAVFFPKYVSYCNQVLSRPPELSSPKQFQDLLKHQDYYLGSCPPEGVQCPPGWHSFHIPSLKLRKVRVENFLV